MDKESSASPSEMETRVQVTGYVELEAHEGPAEDGPVSTGAVQGLKPEC